MKKILIFAMALLPLMLMAQARIGVVNSQQIFDLMPEKAAADAAMPETIKERRVQELQDGDKKMRDFERRAADDIAAQRAALTKPIADRVQAAIRTAAEQGGFDLVLDTAVTPVAYTGPNTADITAMVKALLGLA